MPFLLPLDPNACSSVRHSRLKNLRAKNYHGSDDEWVQIVSYILGQLSGSDGKPDSTSGVEVSATIPGSENNDEDKEMVLIIRKRIQTITVWLSHKP